MAVPVPFSPAFVLLCAALPAAWLAGRALAHAMTKDLGLRAVLPYGLTLAGWLLSVHIASLVAGSLRVGLPAGTLVLAAGGVLAERWRRRNEAALGGEGRSPSSWMILSAAATTALLAPAAFRFWFHDELYVVGHMSIAAELQNGIYPPRHLTFPDLPLRYHFGFDVLSASLTALLHLEVDRAIDVATLGLWFLAWCLFWVLGERLLGRARAFLVPLCGLLGGTMPFYCGAAGGRSLASYVVAGCPKPHAVNPPIVSYFFQHPWSIGVPLGATAILLHTERGSPRPLVRLAALGLVLSALSLSHVVIFAALLSALVVAEAYDGETIDLGRALRLGAVAFAVLVAARLLGGFFTRGGGLPPPRLEYHLGFEDTSASNLEWHLRSFGFLIPLGVAGLLFLRRSRLLFALLLVGSVTVLNTVRYAYSADVVKFGTLAAITLGVLSAATIARVLGERPGPWRRLAAGLLIVPATAGGVLFALTHALDLSDIPKAYREGPEDLSPVEVAAVVWLRDHTRAGEMVYRSGKASHGYAQWGGLPQPEVSWTTKAFALPEGRIAARELLLRVMPPDAGGWQRDGFRWFVLDPSSDDRVLRTYADAWIARGEAREAIDLGPLRIVELLPRAR